MMLKKDGHDDSAEGALKKGTVAKTEPAKHSLYPTQHAVRAAAGGREAVGSGNNRNRRVVLLSQLNVHFMGDIP